MGRHKLVADDALLDLLLKVLSETGPADLTFARAAAQVGLSAATLVQRYGNRDAMIEAVLRHAWDRLDAATQAADAGAPVNPRGAVDLLMRLMPPAAAEYSMTDGLLLLREDIRRPRLRARGAAWGRTLARALGRRLTDDARDAERLGWQMASVWQGAHTWWAFTRRLRPETAIRRSLEDWLRTAGLI